jgi:hypothetical protein
MPAEQREREAPVWNAQKAISSMDAEMRDVPGAGGARELRSAAVENKAGYDVGSGDHQPSRLRAEPLRMRELIRARLRRFTNRRNRLSWRGTRAGRRRLRR